MSTLARDALKTRPQRIGEVYSLLHLKTGQANSQIVSFGGDLTVDAGDATKYALSDTEAVLGQTIVKKAAATLLPLTAGANTAAGQFRKVLIQMDAAGAITTKNGAAVSTVQADAVKPAPDSDKIELGWVEVPASFTFNVTNITLAMLKKAAYWTWTVNVAPGNNGY